MCSERRWVRSLQKPKTSESPRDWGRILLGALQEQLGWMAILSVQGGWPLFFQGKPVYGWMRMQNYEPSHQASRSAKNTKGRAAKILRHRGQLPKGCDLQVANRQKCDLPATAFYILIFPAASEQWTNWRPNWATSFSEDKIQDVGEPTRWEG